MGFMESYKYLDNLCKDMNGIGVTGYIKDMEQEPKGEIYVAGWKRDYLQLKHYRYIRNQIAHENYANESDMCSDRDTVWLDEFYQRIMQQIDPLALCYKETRLHSKIKSIETKTPSTAQCAMSCSQLHQTKKRYGSYGIILLLVIVALSVMIFLLLQLL